MVKQGKIKSSYGMMRVREVLKGKEEREAFEKALENVEDAYYNKVGDFSIKIIFEEPKYKAVVKCLKDISFINNIAKRNNIYLDRPNDEVSYFIYSTSKILL